jgi:hypothetical protein
MRGFQNCACDVVAIDTEGAGEKQGDQKLRTRKKNKANIWAITGKM